MNACCMCFSHTGVVKTLFYFILSGMREREKKINSPYKDQILMSEPNVARSQGNKLDQAPLAPHKKDQGVELESDPDLI